MGGLLTIVPTRGRPEAARALADEYRRTRTDDFTELVFAVDDDDPCRDEYIRHLDHAGASLYIGPRKRMGPTLNHVATNAANGFFGWEAVGFMGDDHRPRTPGWDRRFLSALRASPGVAYGDDQIHGPNLPTAAWISAEIVQRLGYIAPPDLIHLYLDNFWLELGGATSLHYLPDVVIEHLHPIAGKAGWDAGYVEVNSGATQEHDRVEYDRYMSEDWPAALDRIRGS